MKLCTNLVSVFQDLPFGDTVLFGYFMAFRFLLFMHFDFWHFNTIFFNKFVVKKFSAFMKNSIHIHFTFGVPNKIAFKRSYILTNLEYEHEIFSDGARALKARAKPG